MQTTPPSLPTDLAARLKTAATLAELMQRVEASTKPIGADQYRRLAQHLLRLLDGLALDTRLDALLGAFPAAAVLYENARYAQAGLCRSPLDSSLRSELAARGVIDKARALAPAR